MTSKLYPDLDRLKRLEWAVIYLLDRLDKQVYDIDVACNTQDVINTLEYAGFKDLIDEWETNGCRPRVCS